MFYFMVSVVYCSVSYSINWLVNYLIRKTVKADVTAKKEMPLDNTPSLLHSMDWFYRVGNMYKNAGVSCFFSELSLLFFNCYW